MHEEVTLGSLEEAVHCLFKMVEYSGRYRQWSTDRAKAYEGLVTIFKTAGAGKDTTLLEAGTLWRDYIHKHPRHGEFFFQNTGP